MGLKYLWDTNTVIYYLQKAYSDREQAVMSDIIYNHQPTISVITEIELSCWKSAPEKDLIVLNTFISDCEIFKLNDIVKTHTIAIRKDYGLKLPDAIVAATAVAMDLTLITSDRRGFNKVPILKLFSTTESTL